MRRDDSDNTEAAVSVIIPTRNRRVMLLTALQSLIEQNYPRQRYEVIVVDNDSTDGTEEMVQEITNRSNGLVRYFRQDNLGPALARNRGIKESSGEIIAFTDSDCIAHPDWLSAGVQAMQQDQQLGLVVGRVLPPPDRTVTFLSRFGRREQEDFIYGTANMFYRRAALEQVDGFSPFFKRFKHYKDYVVGGEDTEVAWRVKRAGWKSTYVHEALIYHEVERITPLEKLLFEPGRSQILPYLIREIPELRAYMFRRYFLTFETALFDLFLLGLLSGAVVHPALLALAIPFSYRLGRIAIAHRENKMAKFVFFYLYFASQFLFLSYGSIRYRRLLL